MTNNDRLVRALMISSIVLASLLHSVPSMADCDSGGTAESGLHDSIITGTGAGGTGLQASEETGTGTGGTGFGGDDDSGTGTGGTGIFGVVTGFGSVCVNGHEVDYDARTLIRQDGKSATISDLAVGQTVRIQTSRARPLVATHIDVENALAGPIDRVDLNSRRVWIMDQSVELRRGAIVFDRTTGKRTSLERLRSGSFLSVSGLRRADGVVSATRLDQRAASERAIVTAVVRDLGQGTAYVGDTRATFATVGDSSERSPETNHDGQRLRVSGRWNAKTRTLEATRLDDARPFEKQTRRVSIQGFTAPSHADADFRLAGTAVEVRRSGADMPELNIDALVRIEGKIDDRGWLQADRIIVDIPGRHGQPLSSSGDHVQHKKDREDRDDRSGREDREDREDRSGRERADRPERSERSERPERIDRSGRSDD